MKNNIFVFWVIYRLLTVIMLVYLAIFFLQHYYNHFKTDTFYMRRPEEPIEMKYGFCINEICLILLLLLLIVVSIFVFQAWRMEKKMKKTGRNFLFFFEILPLLIFRIRKTPVPYLTFPVLICLALVFRFYLKAKVDREICLTTFSTSAKLPVALDKNKQFNLIGTTKATNSYNNIRNNIVTISIKNSN